MNGPFLAKFARNGPFIACEYIESVKASLRDSGSLKEAFTDQKYPSVSPRCRRP